MKTSTSPRPSPHFAIAKRGEGDTLPASCGILPPATRGLRQGQCQDAPNLLWRTNSTLIQAFTTDNANEPLNVRGSDFSGFWPFEPAGRDTNGSRMNNK